LGVFETTDDNPMSPTIKSSPEDHLFFNKDVFSVKTVSFPCFPSTKKHETAQSPSNVKAAGDEGQTPTQVSRNATGAGGVSVA
jgi:hypothetical protein